MFELAGLMISGISLINDLLATYKDLNTWEEKDQIVDNEWLPLAISKGIIDGQQEDYRWSSERHVATRELKGTYRVVVAYNQDRKVKYRLVQGRTDERLILMKKVSAGQAINQQET